MSEPKILTWQDPEIILPTKPGYYLVMDLMGIPRVAYFDSIGDWYESIGWAPAYELINITLFSFLPDNMRHVLFDDEFGEYLKEDETEKLFKDYMQNHRYLEGQEMRIAWWCEIPPNKFAGELDDESLYASSEIDTVTFLSEIEPIVRKYFSVSKDVPPWKEIEA
jgi:hypothetical protein